MQSPFIMKTVEIILYNSQDKPKHCNIHVKRNIRQFFKWAKYCKRHFPEDNTLMADKDMKKCSLSLTIREMQIKSTKKSHDAPTKMASVERTNHTKCW